MTILGEMIDGNSHRAHVRLDAVVYLCGYWKQHELLMPYAASAAKDPAYRSLLASS